MNRSDKLVLKDIEQVDKKWSHLFGSYDSEKLSSEQTDCLCEMHELIKLFKHRLLLLNDRKQSKKYALASASFFNYEQMMNNTEFLVNYIDNQLLHGANQEIALDVEEVTLLKWIIKRQKEDHKLKHEYAVKQSKMIAAIADVIEGKSLSKNSISWKNLNKLYANYINGEL